MTMMNSDANEKVELVAFYVPFYTYNRSFQRHYCDANENAKRSCNTYTSCNWLKYDHSTKRDEND